MEYREQLLQDLEILNNNVGSYNIDSALRTFCKKYPYIKLDFQMFSNKYVVINNKGARIL